MVVIRPAPKYRPDSRPAVAPTLKSAHEYIPHSDFC
jgi:hypothetical protein